MDPIEAKEVALNHDRTYFATNQFAIRYLRPYIEGEFWPAIDFADGTCVLVVKGERGSRIRTPQEPRQPGEPRRSRMGALDKELPPLGELHPIAEGVAHLAAVALRYGDHLIG